MMRTGYRLYLVLTLALVLAACGDKGKGTYVNKDQKFRIAFPEGWEVKENEMGMDVIGFMPTTGGDDAFRENVYVATSPMDKPLDPDGVLDALVPSMINTITDFKTVGRGVKTIGPQSAAWLRYESRQGKFRITGTINAVTHNDRAYLIYAIAETRFEPLFRDDLEKVVQTFEVIP